MANLIDKTYRVPPKNTPFQHRNDANGKTHIGSWEQNILTGLGTTTFADGSIYVGRVNRQTQTLAIPPVFNGMISARTLIVDGALLPLYCTELFLERCVGGGSGATHFINTLSLHSLFSSQTLTRIPWYMLTTVCDRSTTPFLFTE